MEASATLDLYNRETEERLKGRYPNLQLGFFNTDSNMLLIGQNPGMPSNRKAQADTERMLSGEIPYKTLIRESIIGPWIEKVVSLDDISFTNIVKVPTPNNDLPSQELIDVFLPVTMKQIELLKPKIIVCVGKFSGKFFGLSEFNKRTSKNGISYVMIPHPSWLARQTIKVQDENILESRWVLKQNKLINAWDFDDGTIFLLSRYKGEKTIRVIKGFKWYFHILPQDREKIEKYNFKIVEDGKYLKVFCSYQLFQSIREELEIQTFEADISPSRKYVIDNNLTLEKDLRVLFFDIETDDTQKTVVIGQDKILSWAAVDKEGNEYYSSEKREIDTLLRLKETIDRYDIIVGWNSSKFDLPYIKERFKVNGIKYQFKRVLHVDLMKRCIKLFSPGMVLMGLKGFSLNDMSKAFLNEEKVQRDKSINELYSHFPEELKRYNLQDARLLKNLDDKMKTLELMIQEAYITKTFMDKFFIGNLLDNYILNEAHKEKLRLVSEPTKKELEGRKSQYIHGAFVMEPIDGYYENVYLFDFKSLYPSIIVGWNIGSDSLETDFSRRASENYYIWLRKRKIEEIGIGEWREFLAKQKTIFDPKNDYIQTANNQFFKRKEKSFIGKLVEKLLKEREIYKKELDRYEIETLEYNSVKAQQEIVKEMANSMYGITADKESRYYDKRIAEGITLTGQYLIKLASEISRINRSEILYGDTDSIFLRNPEDIHILEKKINLDIKDFIEKQFELINNIVSLRYEKKFSKFLLLDKKRYCGILSEMDGKKMERMFYRGIEVIQKSTIPFTRTCLEDLLKLLMIENKDLDFIKDWLKKLMDSVFTRPFSPEEITITFKMNRASESYKTPLPHIRLAKEMIRKKEMIDVKEEKQSWTQIKYIVSSKKERKEILPSDYDGNFDRDYYWSVRIFSPVKRILSSRFKEVDWEGFEKQLSTERNQMSLFN